MPKQKYIETTCYFFISICLMLVTFIKLFICVPTFAAYISEFLLSYFYGGSKWLNIFYQYDGNCMLKII